MHTLYRIHLVYRSSSKKPETRPSIEEPRTRHPTVAAAASSGVRVRPSVLHHLWDRVEEVPKARGGSVEILEEIVPGEIGEPLPSLT
jgi:hypothetical protein